MRRKVAQIDSHVETKPVGSDGIGRSSEDDRAHDRARSTAVRIAEILSDSPAANSVMLDIREVSTLADFFVICSGENERQLRAIMGDVSDELAEEGIRPLRVEGTPSDGWIVLDYGEVVVHVFHHELRDYYQIEEHWSDAQRVLTIQ